MPIEKTTDDHGVTIYRVHSELRAAAGDCFTRERAEAELLAAHADLGLKTFRTLTELGVLYDALLREEDPDIEALIAERIAETRERVWQLITEGPLVLLAEGKSTLRVTIDGKEVNLSPESISAYCADRLRAAIAAEAPLREESWKRSAPALAVPPDPDADEEAAAQLSEQARRLRKRARELRAATRKPTAKRTRKAGAK